MKELKMRNIAIVATAVTFLTASVAVAEGLGVFGSLEYAVEAQTVEANVGLDYAMGDFTITPTATINDASGSVEFVGADVTVTYAIVGSTAAYVTVEADSNLNYSDVTVGVSFSF
jgi:hypothetical protein